jgi:nitroreductase
VSSGYDPIALMLGRRSHRVGFDARPVPDEVLAEVVRCGLAAPSSKNARPWRFHVVTDPVLLARIVVGVQTADGAETYVPVDPETGAARPEWPSSVLESAAIVGGAPAAIFVENLGWFSGGRRMLASKDGDELEGRLVAYMLECAGVGAAIQNLWLAAEALGLRASFVGDVGVDEQRIVDLLGMDGELVGALAVGYSDLDPEVRRPTDDDPTQVRWHRGEGSA